ncbi:DUF1194 domain-containing protein [Sulfitobacter sp. S190]|uniref:DUF1194 domain-containing protein n=1 Tax=Sulfitobacter sp. S190 TaxID=2867022 RepID=UPI0021A952CE|nr:DUF1194 domain-containing protein [Sulfitobacter sp. S190]UWR21685.1 DUF1194 domain-containing protein [Sulfitobacter sp. S190]
MRLIWAMVVAMWPVTGAACDLALVLAVDVSGSVDRDEYRTQMDGLAAGLRDGTVAQALVDAQARVSLVQWSGSTRQRQTIPWTAMTDAAQVATFADRVRDDARVWRNFSTAVGEAVQLSLESFAQVALCRRKVIDVSGDGVSNEGLLPATLRPALTAAGVTVNALAIETDDADLTGWFYENVIHGPGAFVITANGFEDYPAQIRRKLQREITRQVGRLAQ